MLVEFDFHVLQLRFKVSGRNSLGNGPESAVSSKVAT